MAVRERCLYCGSPVSTNGYCTSCRLSQDFLRKAINTSKYYYNMGLDKARVRDLSGAIDSLKSSLRYNKNNTLARNLLGLIYYEMGEIVPALNCWVVSVNINPGKDNLAVRYLKELRDDPSTLENASTTAREFNLALEHAKRYDIDLAMINLNKAVSLNQNFIKAHLLMALIYIGKNRGGMARKCLAHVMSLDRTNPTALHYLRELGESEENITRMADSYGETEELFNYYGVEEEKDKDKRPSKMVYPRQEKGKRNQESVYKRYKELNLARYSNIYMVAGIILGIVVCYFLIIPSVRKNYNEKLGTREQSYIKELSSKNSEIESLNSTVKSLNEKASKTDASSVDKDQEISDLKEEVSQLKKKLGESAKTADEKGDGNSAGEGDNSSAEDGNSAQETKNNEADVNDFLPEE